MKTMHKLLARLMRRHLPADVSRESLAPFLEAVSESFTHYDHDRKMMERSLTLVSDELLEINQNQVDNIKQLEETLVKQRALLDASPEAIFSFLPGGKMYQINRSACELIGMSGDEVRKLSASENLNLFISKLTDPELFLAEVAKIKDDNTIKLRGFVTTKDNRYFEYISHPELLNGVYIGRVWCYRDITEIQKNQALLRYHAYHDGLTGLPNRTLILETIDQLITIENNYLSRIAIFFIDLDDFKKINDTSGHEEGDKCLVEIAQRLMKQLSPGDTLGRLGGDEFLVISQQTARLSCLETTCKNILRLFTSPFSIGELTYSLSCSIGISIYPQDGITPEELIRKADMAMYQAKQKGKNTYYFYDNHLEQQALQRVSIEYQLREVIAQQQLVLHYQPKVCLNTGKLYGVEALIRWQLSDNTTIYPDSFINVAESTGLIRQITRWVLHSVCKTLQSWQHTPLCDTPISINITAIDFSDRDFLSEVFAAIDHHQIKPELLEFELTESIFFDDIRWVKQTIEQLKSKNIKLSIDDFGIGYSSFGYLQDMDINYLKIDRSFIRGLHTSSRSLSIVKSIIDIGTNLGLGVIAEGIEEENELACLLQAGCNYGQGYYFSKAVPAAEILAYACRHGIK